MPIHLALTGQEEALGIVAAVLLVALGVKFWRLAFSGFLLFLVAAGLIALNVVVGFRVAHHAEALLHALGQIL